MAWLTICSDDNKIIEQDASHTEWLSIVGVGGGVWKRTVTVSRYRWIGLTYDAAVAQVVAVLADDPDASPSVDRENESNGYSCNVGKETYSEWESV